MRRGSKENTTYKRETDENRLNIDINEDLSTSPGTSTNQLLGTVSNTNDMFAVLHIYLAVNTYMYISLKLWIIHKGGCRS